ncbi:MULTISPECIES: DUF2846 domain-containing protein [unclassified Roseovarius]|uniref:DUF2846 domain-containing protein n=1 Tax=unclassified Roseovarius TaxID=2614913 RepID=UPI00273DFA6A|nr:MULTISPECIES: DUF2846 domain-containing protein [unclassified Roseovarius]
MNLTKTGAGALLAALFLSACAETPQTTEAPQKASTTEAPEAVVEQPAAAEPAMAAASGDGETKIVIYRTSYAGFAVQPKVFVDGKEAATCTPGRATTVKVAPGTHRLTARTLSEKELTVSVAEGGTSYVRCSLTIGLVVGGAKLTEVAAAEAAPKVAKLKQK